MRDRLVFKRECREYLVIYRVGVITPFSFAELSRCNVNNLQVHDSFHTSVCAGSSRGRDFVPGSRDTPDKWITMPAK